MGLASSSGDLSYRSTAYLLIVVVGRRRIEPIRFITLIGPTARRPRVIIELDDPSKPHITSGAGTTLGGYEMETLSICAPCVLG